MLYEVFDGGCWYVIHTRSYSLHTQRFLFVSAVVYTIITYCKRSVNQWTFIYKNLMYDDGVTILLVPNSNINNTVTDNRNSKEWNLWYRELKNISYEISDVTLLAFLSKNNKNDLVPLFCPALISCSIRKLRGETIGSHCWCP